MICISRTRRSTLADVLVERAHTRACTCRCIGQREDTAEKTAACEVTRRACSPLRQHVREAVREPTGASTSLEEAIPTAEILAGGKYLPRSNQPSPLQWAFEHPRWIYSISILNISDVRALYLASKFVGRPLTQLLDSTYATTVLQKTSFCR